MRDENIILDSERVKKGIEGSSRRYLTDIELKYGPEKLLRDVLKKVEGECKKMGVDLSYTTAREFLEVNRANRDSWPPLLTIFDPEVSGADLNSMIYIVARKDGRIIATQAVRHLDWTGTNFKEEAESQRLFYKAPSAMKSVSERVQVAKGDAERITGNVAFTGAQWVHPSARKSDKSEYRLSELLTRAARALAIGVWNVEKMHTFMAPGPRGRGVAERSGYDHIVDNAIQFDNLPIFPGQRVFLSLLWATQAETLQRLERFMETTKPAPDA